MIKNAYILVRQSNEQYPYRVVTEDENGVEPATGWCKTVGHCQKTADSLEARGYKVAWLREDEAVMGQEEFFKLTDQFEQARANGDDRKVLLTKNGYELGDVASALQKSIRRGEEEQALWWAGELEQRYYKYMWRRLLVMVGEDIGLAEPMGPAIVGALHQNYLWYREVAKKTDDHALWNLVGHAILWMCRAKKSREVNEFAYYVFDKNGFTANGKPEIPDYAFDKHTSRGREMGRDLRHFFIEGARLENESTDVVRKYRWFIEDQHGV